MPYSLIVDIGNSQIEIGIFDEDIVGKFFFETKKLDKDFDTSIIKTSLEKLSINPKDIGGGMIFSVVPNITHLVKVIIKGELGIDLEIFDPKSILKEFRADIDNPSEVGQDLLADIMGAIHFYGAPILVSDLGTVTKNIIIDKNGVFHGVSFIPGFQVTAGIFSDKTAQLPELNNLERPNYFFGKNTIDAMRSGIYHEHVATIKKFMSDCDEYFGYKFKKVITGGLSTLFKEDFPKEDYTVDPLLVLKGMHLIYKNQRR